MCRTRGTRPGDALNGFRTELAAVLKLGCSDPVKTIEGMGAVPKIRDRPGD